MSFSKSGTGFVQQLVDQLLIGLVADEDAVGVEPLADRAGVKVVAHVVVVGINAELVRLLQEHGLLHQLLADLLLVKLEHDGILGRLRALLAQPGLGDLLHARLLDLVAGGKDAAIPVRINDGVGVGRRWPIPLRPGIRYRTMVTEAAPMMTTISALTMRLSVCRKRIMDGFQPSTLYARTRSRAGGSTELAACAARPADAQFLLNATLSL